jgi:hypothetical protein
MLQMQRGYHEPMTSVQAAELINSADLQMINCRLLSLALI